MFVLIQYNIDKLYPDRQCISSFGLSAQYLRNAHILKQLTQPACPASPKYGRGQLGSIWGKKSLPSPFPFLLYLFYEIQGKKINFICCYVTSTDDILSHCCLPAAGWTHLLRTQFRDFILIILGWTGVPTYQGIGQTAICNIIMTMNKLHIAQ